MSDISIAIAPVSTDNPCGENIYEDRDLGGSRLQPLVDSACGAGRVGAVEGQRRDTEGPTGVAAWRKVEEIAYETFRETKHLELGWYFLLSQAHLRGLQGMADGIDVMAQLLSRYRDNLYPAEADNDHEFRRTILDRLNDSVLIAAVDGVRITDGRGGTHHTLSEYRRSMLGEGLDPKEIEQGYAETVKEKPGFYDQLGSACGGLRESISRLRSVVSEAFESYEPPLASLEQRIRELEAVVSAFGGVPLTASPAESDASNPGSAGNKASAQVMGAESLSSREDVVKILSKLIQFYQRTEPTSPVPILLERASRVAMMDFKEIVREFNLSGSPSIQDVLGWHDDS